jgi:hypothetical protein
MPAACALCIIVLLIAAPGCRRSDTANPTAENTETPPTTQPAAPQLPPPRQIAVAPPKHAATAPAATEPLASYITIDHRIYTFPVARLYLHRKDDQLTATLFSDDGRTADYAGNSYLLEMKLDADDPKQIATANWRYKAPNSDRVDSPYGIFLDGVKYQLQPFDVAVVFAPPEHGSSLVTASLVGDFLLFDTRDTLSPGAVVPVTAKLTAKPEIK